MYIVELTRTDGTSDTVELPGERSLAALEYDETVAHIHSIDPRTDYTTLVVLATTIAVCTVALVGVLAGIVLELFK